MKNLYRSLLVLVLIALLLLSSACAFQVAGSVDGEVGIPINLPYVSLFDLTSDYVLDVYGYLYIPGNNCSIGNHEGPFTEWTVERVERPGEDLRGAFNYVDIFRARCKSCNGFIEEFWSVFDEEEYE